MYKEFLRLSQEYNMPIENVLSIALNRYGILSKEIEDSRIRFSLNFNDTDIERFFAVCVNTYSDSPFELKNEKIYLDGNVIGKVVNIEKDTCTSTYFRDKKQAITLNSNSRSKCIGCTFCGTYSLTEDDSVDFTTKENVKKYFYKLLNENNLNDLSNMKNITVCTGCFDNEDKLVEHLYTLNSAFREMNFNGNLNYIGSQLRTYSKIDEVSKNIDNFGLFLTLEKFLEREKFMRKEKASLTLEKAHELLKYSTDKNITSTFLYILGLEDLETVKKYFTYFKDSINKFPIVQVFQDYTKYQELYRCNEAKDFEYYVKARKVITDIYKDTTLLPESWECYRGLHFETKDNGENKCLLLKKN